MKNHRLSILAGLIHLAFPSFSYGQVVNYNFNGGPGATFADGSQLSGTMTVNYNGSGSSAVTAANLTLSGTRTGTFTTSSIQGSSNFYTSTVCGNRMPIYETALSAGGTSLYLDTISTNGSLIPGTTGVHTSLGYGGNSYALTALCSSFNAANSLPSAAAGSQYANMTVNAAQVVTANASNFNIATSTTNAIPRLVNTITSNLTLFANSIGNIIQQRFASIKKKAAEAAATSAQKKADAAIISKAKKRAAEVMRQDPKYSGLSADQKAIQMRNLTGQYAGMYAYKAVKEKGGSQAAAVAEWQRIYYMSVTSGKSSGDEELGDYSDLDVDLSVTSAWVQPFTSYARQNQLNNISPYTANTSGLVAGVDHQLDANWTFGGTLTYANNYTASTISDAGNSMVTNMYQIGAYGQYAFDEETNLQMTAGIGVNQNSGSRITPDNSTASARYNSIPINLGLALNHSIAVSSQTTFSPTLSANWMSINNNQINETGAGNWNLTTQSNNTNQLQFNLNGRLEHALTDEWSLNGVLGGGYAAINPSMTLISSFAGAPNAAFTSTGNALAPWMSNAGVGVKYSAEEGHDFFVNYDAQIREGFLNQTASMKYKYAF